MDHSPVLLDEAAPPANDSASAAVGAEWWLRARDTAFAAAGTGVAVLDRDLRYRYVIDVPAGLNGLAAAAHLGRTAREAIPAWADTAEPLLRRVVLAVLIPS
jgi:hypothetical protein